MCISQAAHKVMLYQSPEEGEAPVTSMWWGVNMGHIWGNLSGQYGFVCGVDIESGVAQITSVMNRPPSLPATHQGISRMLGLSREFGMLDDVETSGKILLVPVSVRSV